MVIQIDKSIKENKILELAKIEAKNSSLFWSSVKNVFKNINKDSHHLTDSKQWNSYLTRLLNVKSDSFDTQFLDYVKTAIPILEQESGEEGPLDGNISIHDVR